MLTARGEPMDRILGLELGADDYLRQALRAARTAGPRQGAAAPPPNSGPTTCCASAAWRSTWRARVARLDGKTCDLTSHQFDLLVVLAQSPGRVLSRDQIMDLAQGPPAGSLRPLHRRAHLAHPCRHRGRPEEPAARADGARRRLRVCPQAETPTKRRRG
jgi:DNA-binding response OmpR family regulator